AQRFTIDYQGSVYSHVKDRIRFRYMDQQDNYECFKQCIRVTGFGTEELHHIAVVGLDEADAASIAVLKASAVGCQKGDLLFTLGGMADFSLIAHRLYGV
ncbi:unnamed protein product, partial [Clonostachys byssicola]